MDGGENPHAKTERRRGNFYITLVTLSFGRILGSKSARAGKSGKIPFFVEGSLPFIELSREVAGASRVCVLFVEVLFFSHTVAAG